MAASEQSTFPDTNIPEYEYIGVNTKPFLIGSVRDEWMTRLRPKDYSYQQEDKDTFEANFAEAMGIRQWGGWAQICLQVDTAT